MKLYFQHHMDFQAVRSFGLGRSQFSHLHDKANAQEDFAEAKNIAAFMATKFGLPGLIVYYQQLKREIDFTQQHGEGHARLAERALSVVKIIQALLGQDNANDYQAAEIKNSLPDFADSEQSLLDYLDKEANALSTLIGKHPTVLKRVAYMTQQFITDCQAETKDDQSEHRL